MRIVVTGGSSFVGAHFCLMAAQRHEVYALHHATPLRLNGVIPVKGDLRRERDRAHIAELQPDAIVHLAAKIRGEAGKHQEATEVARALNTAMMDAVLSAGCPVLYGSSTVVRWTQQTPYGDQRKADEERLRTSGLPYAIVRPCAPYGPPLSTHRPKHRESFQTLVSFVRNSPVVPVIGDGKYRRQPIHTEDLSAAMLALLERGLKGQELDAGGRDALSMNDIIDALGKALGKSPLKLHIPKMLAVKASPILPGFEPSLVGAVDTDELADPAPMTAATGVSPRGFSEGLWDLL